MLGYGSTLCFLRISIPFCCFLFLYCRGILQIFPGFFRTVFLSFSGVNVLLFFQGFAFFSSKCGFHARFLGFLEQLLNTFFWLSLVFV